MTFLIITLQTTVILIIFLKLKKTIRLMLDKLIKNSFLIFLFILVSITNANAYIDPGTGSFIIQAILALVGSIIFYLGYPLRVLKNIYKKIFKKNKNKKNIED